MSRILILLSFVFISNQLLFGQISTAADQFILLDGEQFHYTDYGEGYEVILCLHGIALSSLSYRSSKAYFDPTKYRVLALDLKGHGFSAKPRDSDYSLEKQADIVQQFLDQMNIDRVNLIGHSYGGMVSLFLNFKQSKDSLSFVILTTTLLDTPAYNQHLPLFFRVLKTRIGAFFILRLPPINVRSRVAINGAFHNYSLGVSEYLNIYKTLLGQKEYLYSIGQVAKQVIPENFEELSISYKSFDVPFLLIWGSHDKLIDIRHGYRLESDIPNANLVVIDKTAHNPHEEKPDVVYSLIKEFIDISQ